MFVLFKSCMIYVFIGDIILLFVHHHHWSRTTFGELLFLCQRRQSPTGINVESVAWSGTYLVEYNSWQSDIISTYMWQHKQHDKLLNCSSSDWITKRNNLRSFRIEIEPQQNSVIWSDFHACITQCDRCPVSRGYQINSVHRLFAPWTIIVKTEHISKNLFDIWTNS